MRLVLTLLVRDEEDIVADMLRFHFALGVDAAIVMDNASTDATPEILRELAAEHEIHLRHNASSDYDQAAWVTGMARDAAGLGADWVINADADEFHWPTAGTLRDVFEAVPGRYGTLELPISHFVPRPEQPGAWHERLRLRETLSRKPSGKSTARNVAHRAHPEIVVHMGNHAVSGPPLEPVPAWRPITVLHFPLRSYAQYERKIAGAGERFTGGYSIHVPGEKEAGIWNLYQAGRLPQSYAEKSVDDAAAAEQLRSGRLVLDDRLARFLTGGPGPPPPPPVGGRMAYPGERAAVAELRAACEQAIHLAETDPRHQALERDLEAARARTAELEARVGELKARNAALKDRIARLS